MNEEQEIIKEGEFDYHLALLFHINRISKLISTFPVATGTMEAGVYFTEETRKYIENSFFNSVKLLECMLSPYIDEEYRNDLTKAKEIWKKEKFDYMEAGLDRYALLLKLMDRLNLLLDKTTKAVV